MQIGKTNLQIVNCCTWGDICNTFLKSKYLLTWIYGNIRKLFSILKKNHLAQYSIRHLGISDTLSESSMPTTQAKDLETGQQLHFGHWCTNRSLDETRDGGFLQGEQTQVSWNRKDAS